MRSIARRWVAVANNSSPRSATVRLVVAIALGVLISVVGTWFFFSGGHSSLEREYTFTYLALGIVGLMAAGLWFRRMQSTPAKHDPVWFLFRLCGALSLVAVAVLFLWQGLYPPIPPLWSSLGTFSAMALVVVYVVLALYRLVQRIRNYTQSSHT
jgi:hypothetical protein